jgi:hypothetical protein
MSSYPVLIHRMPEVMQHAVQADKHLIEMPCIARSGPAPVYSPGELSAELTAPLADALVSDDHAALGQGQLDVT